MRTVWRSESSRLDEVYINSVTSELCERTRGDVNVRLLLFTGWPDDQIPLLSPPFAACSICPVKEEGGLLKGGESTVEKNIVRFKM